MTPAAIRSLCLSLPGATESIQWGDDRVFKVGGKMFAVIGAGIHADSMSFKASDESFRLLSEMQGLEPAPYLARAKWVRIKPLTALPPNELEAYLRRAYEIVRGGLSKKAQAALGDSRPYGGAPAANPKTRTALATSPARRASRGRSKK